MGVRSVATKRTNIHTWNIVPLDVRAFTMKPLLARFARSVLAPRTLQQSLVLSYHCIMKPSLLRGLSLRLHTHRIELPRLEGVGKLPSIRELGDIVEAELRGPEA